MQSPEDYDEGSPSENDSSTDENEIPSDMTARDFLVNVINKREQYHISDRERKKYKNNETLQNPQQITGIRSLKMIIDGFDDEAEATNFPVKKFDLQRAYRWMDRFKGELIDSVAVGFDIGRIVLWLVLLDGGAKEYQLIDGLQRITTLTLFRKGLIKWRGRTFDQLSKQDRIEFDGYPVTTLILSNYSYGMARKYFQVIQNSIPLSPGELAYASDDIPAVYYFKTTCRVFPKFSAMYNLAVQRNTNQKVMEVVCKIIAHHISEDLTVIKDLNNTLEFLRSLGPVNDRHKAVIRIVLTSLTNMFQLPDSLSFSDRNLPQRITSTDLILISYMLQRYPNQFSDERVFGNFYRNVFGSKKIRESILDRESASIWHRSIRGSPLQPLSMDSRLDVLMNYINEFFKMEHGKLVPKDADNPIFQLQYKKVSGSSTSATNNNKRRRNFLSSTSSAKRQCVSRK